MMRERDQFLDRLRTLAIVWVLMVHVLYWLNFMPHGTQAVIKSWLLLEMPLFFFITGAGVALSKPRPWGTYVLRSARRLLIPYWCYALVCVVLTAVCSGGVDWSLLGHWILPVDPQPVALPYLTDALWYVPVYLLCVAVIPLLRRGQNRPLPMIALLVTLLLFFERQGWSYPRNVAFYSFWIFVGLHYPQLKKRYIDRRSKGWELLLTATACVALLLVLCRARGISADMQQHKFPPGGVFLLYSLAGMSLLGLAAPLLVKAMDALGRVSALDWSMKLLSRRSLSVFLYQPFAFLLLNALREQFLSGVRHAVQLPVCCVLILPLAVALAVVFGPLERLGKGKA